MKFAVWILVIAAALSLLALLAGEMLPKGTESGLFFKIFRLDDPFRSWWFQSMLGILAVSLLVCVIERAPLLIKQAFMRIERDNPDQLAGMPISAKMTIRDGERKVTELFKKLGFAVVRREVEGKTLFSGMSGGLSRLGPLFTHAGMFLLIVGGLIVSITMEQKRVIGAPGQIVGEPEWGFRLRIDDFRIIYYPVGLNQWVEAKGGRRGKVSILKGDSAMVVFGAPPNALTRWYAKSDLKTDFMMSDGGNMTPFQGNIKSYLSEVTVLDGDKELYTKNIEVNSPLREGGFRFYQTSFQPISSIVKVDSVVLHCESEAGHAQVRVKVGGQAPLPWGGYTVSVPQFFNDFKMDEQFKPFSASTQLLNPAARVSLYQNGELIGSTWLFARSDAHMGGDLPVKFNLVDFTDTHTGSASFATVLEVTKERGRPIVWAGFFLMTLGLMFAYMTSQRHAWGIVIKRSDGRDDVHLAAANQRDAEHFRRIWQEQTDELQKS